MIWEIMIVQMNMEPFPSDLCYQGYWLIYNQPKKGWVSDLILEYVILTLNVRVKGHRDILAFTPMPDESLFAPIVAYTIWWR
jgi:hypothetical protein